MNAWIKLNIKVFSLFLALIIASIFFMQPVHVRADFGSITIPPTSVYTPGQNAIVAWNGEEEVLILSIDSWAVSEKPLLRILPLPAPPDKIEKADRESFHIIDELIRYNAPPDTNSFRDEVVFKTIIGAHDITVVRAEDIETFEEWLAKYLEEHGLETISLPELTALIAEYIEDGIFYFVLDLTATNLDPRSIEPILYKFKTHFLWFPLKNTRLSEGSTRIKLFAFTPEEIPTSISGLEVARYLDPLETPVTFPVSNDEMEKIAPDINGLFQEDAWFTALAFDGDITALEYDLRFQYQSKCDVIIHPPVPTPLTNITAEVLITTPTPCWNVEFGPVTRIGNTFSVRVDLLPLPVPCIQVVKVWRKKFEIGHLPEGSYAFVVESYIGGEPVCRKTREFEVIDVIRPKLDILDPTQVNPAEAGPYSDPYPIKVLVKVLLPYILEADGIDFQPQPVHISQGLNPFRVLVGGKEARILSIRWVGADWDNPIPPGGKYELTIQPPTQESEAYYNLEVMFHPYHLWREITEDVNAIYSLYDIEEEAVHYSQPMSAPVIFQGIVYSDEQCGVFPICYGECFCGVNISKIIHDPYHFLDDVSSLEVCYGNQPLNLKKGDRVEVSGTYWKYGGPLQCVGRVTTGETGYIKRLPISSCLFTATITANGLDLGLDYVNESDVMIGIDEAANTIPLPPPPQAYTVFTKIAGNYFQDIRAAGNPSENWVIHVDVPEDIKESYPDTYYPTLSWSTNAFCNIGFFRLWSCDSNGGLISILVQDMTATGSYTMTGADGDHVCVVWSEDIVVRMHINGGWSMISLPIDPWDPRVGSVFPDAPAVFAFHSKYILLGPEDKLEVGQGYWIHLPESRTYTLLGQAIESYIIPDAPAGWSMIGACTYLSKPSVENGSIRAVFGFTNKYVFMGSGDEINPFKPGKGYWINLTEPTTLTVQAIGHLREALNLMEDEEMP